MTTSMLEMPKLISLMLLKKVLINHFFGLFIGQPQLVTFKHIELGEQFQERLEWVSLISFTVLSFKRDAGESRMVSSHFYDNQIVCVGVCVCLQTLENPIESFKFKMAVFMDSAPSCLEIIDNISNEGIYRGNIMKEKNDL